jgi:hypothetical protein
MSGKAVPAVVGKYKWVYCHGCCFDTTKGAAFLLKAAPIYID